MSIEQEKLERIYVQRPELRGLAWSAERAPLVGPPGSAGGAGERWRFAFSLPRDEDDPPGQPPRVLKLTLDGAGHIVKTIGSKAARCAPTPAPREEEP